MINPANLVNMIRVIHFVYRCKFAGRNCSPKSVQEVSTDIGRCYAFNNDPSDRQISSASGSLNC